ncbi:MAG: hypothetical protein Alis3KO_31680 [Aliiglaciecola sp.]
MFRYLIVLAEIVVLVTVLRSSFVQYLLSDVQQSLTSFMSEITLRLEQTQLDDLRYSLAPYTGHMRDFQKDYLNQVTESSANLEHFHNKYCVQREINPFVNGANLELVCHTINSSKLVDVKKAT